MQMNFFSREENRLFSMIADSLTNTQKSADKDVSRDEETDLHILTELAGHHAVLPVIYQQLIREPGLTKEDFGFLEMVTKQTAAEFYQILFNARNSIQLLSQHGISVVLLKGASVARFYPVAEARKSSDVDLFLTDSDDIVRAGEILKAAGYRPVEEQHANHHELWGTPDNHALELHTTLIEPTEDKRLNEYVGKRYRIDPDTLLEEKILGISFPVFSDDLLAFHLLLHMLMDFLAAGFGLKLLCDWVVFWNRRVDSSCVENFLADVEGCGLSKFLSAVTTVCVRFLGLCTDGSGTLQMKDGELYYENGTFCSVLSEEVSAEFMQDILDAERHGKPDNERMVVLKESGVLGYIHRFHHQTVLAFPKASRLIFPLPVLYILVFIQFIRNNYSVRDGQSIRGIIKNTNKRSRLAKKLLVTTHRE